MASVLETLTTAVLVWLDMGCLLVLLLQIPRSQLHVTGCGLADAGVQQMCVVLSKAVALEISSCLV